MKRLVLAVGVLAAALLVPGTAGGALVNIKVDDDFYDPANATFEFPASPDARWDWDALGGGTANEHTVTQDKGLFRVRCRTSPTAPSTSAPRPAPSPTTARSTAAR